MSLAPSSASKAASQARRRALGKARRAIRRTESQTKFTGEKPSVFLYGGATLIGLFKDLLDFVGVGLLPGIGTVVTICFNILIFLLLTIFDNSGGGNKVNRKIMQGLIILLVTIVEGLGFGLNFLPLEVLTMIVLYLFARHAWQKEKKKVDEENRVSALNQQREQLGEARQARMEEEQEAANNASYQKQAANDDLYQQPMDNRRRV